MGVLSVNLKVTSRVVVLVVVYVYIKGSDLFTNSLLLVFWAMCKLEVDSRRCFLSKCRSGDVSDAFKQNPNQGFPQESVDFLVLYSLMGVCFLT